MSAREIVTALGGTWHGTYGLVPGPGHSKRDRSMKVIDGTDGDIVCHSFVGDDWREFKDNLRHRGLLPDRSGVQRNSQPWSRTNVASAGRSAPDNRNDRVAQKIWSKSVPATGTLVEIYLRTRGITIPAPASIRYWGAAKHSATGLILPAMVAAVSEWPSKKIRAVHRTYLTMDGLKKAPVSPDKMMLGPVKGGAVRLAPAGETMVVGEGIETVLSVMQETGLPAWAAMSKDNIPSLVLPALPAASDVVIAADNDSHGRGYEAAKKAAAQWTAEGRKVRIALPPIVGKDFNDLLLMPGNVVAMGGGR